MKERVSEGMSHQINEITHSLYGWTMKERVSESMSHHINEITHSLWVDNERKGQRKHVTPD